MSDDNRPEIILDGDISPLRQKLRDAAADLRKFGTDGEKAIGSMTAPLAKLQSAFVAVSGLLAGGAVFKEAVKQAADFTEQSMKLGAALGSSATQASTFITAFEDIDVTQQDFLVASKGLSKEIKNNEDVLQSMGLKTRDAAGHLRPLNELVVDGIEVVKGYRAGTDRAIAGQVMFGKGFEMTGNLLKLSNELLKENAELQQRLGIVTGQDNVEAWDKYDAAGDKAHLTLKAFGVTIGNALIPILTKLSNWFVAIGPAAVGIIKIAIGGLATTFHVVTQTVTMLWETLNAMVVTVAEPIRALGAAIMKALSGDWAGARDEVAGIGTKISSTWSEAAEVIKAKNKEVAEEIRKLFVQGPPAAAPSTGGKSATKLLTPPAAVKKEAEPSFMGTYDARLAEIKNMYEQENTLRQFSKEQELAYWRELQQHLTLTSKDAVAIAKRTATLELEIRRETATKMRALDTVMLDSRRAAALGQIELEEQQANFAEENGQITKMELLEQEEQFARRRFEIEYQALLERQELLKNDPNTTPAALAQVKEQMLAIERQYVLKKGDLGQGKKKEGESGLFGDVGDSFANAAQKMLTTATTLRQQLGNIFQSIFSSFISNLVSKPLANFVATKARMLAVELGFLEAETTAKSGSATTSMAITGGQAMVEVGNKGASAAAGAADSVASIPYIGPVLAAAAFAATLGMVLGARSNVKSAAMGFDIPRGLNPMTQLHEEEMVLPSPLAKAVRGMAARGTGEEGGASALAPVSLTVNAVDAKSVERLFRDNGHIMAKELRRQVRNFAPKKS